MRKAFQLVACALVMLLTATACGNSSKKTDDALSQPISDFRNDPGDETLYGLACDGCTDSVVVILPFAGGDPMTYSVVNAMKSRKVFGFPKIGDKIAVILSDDSTEAVMVINLDRLCGDWCYTVTPTLKHLAGWTDAQYEKFKNNIPDTIREKYFIPREYGFSLAANNTVAQLNNTLVHEGKGEFQIVEYPEQKVYEHWKLHNGRLIFTATNRMELEADSTKKLVETHDTADFVGFFADTLTLRFGNIVQGFHRKSKAAPKTAEKEDRKEKEQAD